MKRTVLMTGALAATAMALAPGVTYAASAGGAPTSGGGTSPSTVVRPDNKPDPLQKKQAELRRTAVDQLIKGEATTATVNGKRVIVVDDGKPTAAQQKARGKNAKAAKPKYVEYDPEQTANIFTVLTDFGTKTDPTAGGGPGPQHNQIPEPDRTIDGTASDDNSTYWEKDFNRAHYKNMMFGTTGESFSNFYKSQSQGRYKAQGDVSDWVTVPYNEARYGSNTGSEADRYWSYIGDTATSWYTAQKSAGKTDAQIKTELKKYDVWDRYDYDHDGDFNEPDGYIDHFQAIHAGEGEEAGGGAQGADAIWSHRWAVQTGAGKAGPTGNLNGGAQIGNTGIWIRDYTTEPENGGLGVFAHEYGHDLGLPDLYDTTNTSTNSVSFWSLMNSGSWLNHGGNAIGTTPGYMGAWERTQLGWSDTQTVRYGNSGKVSLGPADQDSVTKPQTLAISLPDKTIATKYNTPKTGSYEWWSGRDDDLNNSLTRTIDLTGATSGKISASVWYDIEADYDYLYGQVSTDGGATWNNVGTPVTGTSTGWSTVSYDLTPYAGKKLTFRFLYQTDGGTNGAGAFLDDIATTVGTTTTTDGAESASSVWTPAGFTRMNGTDTRVATNYYLAESRRYSGYDTTLKQGPYNFGFGPRRPDVVEHFPYQDGVLIWYVNNEFKDNNTSAHPGGGLVLPVDAHATPMVWPDGVAVSNRIQPYDATFGLDRTDAFTLHKQGLAAKVPSRPAVSTFDDTNPNAYYYVANPAGSVKVAGSGTRIKVASKQGDGYSLVVSFPTGSMRRQ
ncbi:immune inhibitor A domain-containing protein [Allobranchiibius sp. GilTou73]|uniref:immune inhibitor A domain-containing protein n=1 Tax=Allobranchiibius sp. GilTou73 TaxID=2904523 RepID=UPI001F3FB245|nr:immune inhibitor A domain-containing protein [Allobranchiibius sp. GilTou73]UIJ36235.1 immune inhibitor A [Allobranchiibius sp. GilTou73]